MLFRYVISNFLEVGLNEYGLSKVIDHVWVLLLELLQLLITLPTLVPFRVFQINKKYNEIMFSLLIWGVKK